MAPAWGRGHEAEHVHVTNTHLQTWGWSREGGMPSCARDHAFCKNETISFSNLFFSTTTKNPRLCCGNVCQPRRSRTQIYCSYSPGRLIRGGGVLSRTQTLGRSCEASRSGCSEATCGTRGQTLCFCYCKAVFTPQRRFFTPEAVVI